MWCSTAQHEASKHSTEKGIICYTMVQLSVEQLQLIEAYHSNEKPWKNIFWSNKIDLCVGTLHQSINYSNGRYRYHNHSRLALCRAPKNTHGAPCWLPIHHWILVFGIISLRAIEAAPGHSIDGNVYKESYVHLLHCHCSYQYFKCVFFRWNHRSYTIVCIYNSKCCVITITQSVDHRAQTTGSSACRADGRRTSYFTTRWFACVNEDFNANSIWNTRWIDFLHGHVWALNVSLRKFNIIFRRLSTDSKNIAGFTHKTSL